MTGPTTSHQGKQTSGLCLLCIIKLLQGLILLLKHLLLLLLLLRPLLLLYSVALSYIGTCLLTCLAPLMLQMTSLMAVALQLLMVILYGLADDAHMRQLLPKVLSSNNTCPIQGSLQR